MSQEKTKSSTRTPMTNLRATNSTATTKKNPMNATVKLHFSNNQCQSKDCWSAHYPKRCQRRIRLWRIRTRNRTTRRRLKQSRAKHWRDCADSSSKRKARRTRAAAERRHRNHWRMCFSWLRANFLRMNHSRNQRAVRAMAMGTATATKRRNKPQATRR